MTKLKRNKKDISHWVPWASSSRSKSNLVQTIKLEVGALKEISQERGHMLGEALRCNVLTRPGQ